MAVYSILLRHATRSQYYCGMRAVHNTRGKNTSQQYSVYNSILCLSRWVKITTHHLERTSVFVWGVCIDIYRVHKESTDYTFLEGTAALHNSSLSKTYVPFRGQAHGNCFKLTDIYLIQYVWFRHPRIHAVYSAARIRMNTRNTEDTFRGGRDYHFSWLARLKLDNCFWSST